jgi:hypothetical protein
MRAHGSGFGGKGFKFDDDEEQAQKDRHKMEVRGRADGSPLWPTGSTRESCGEPHWA